MTASTVRAVALAALAKNGKISRRELYRYQRHLKGMNLFGKAQFLSAASTSSQQRTDFVPKSLI